MVDPNNVDQIANLIRLLENHQMRKTFAERNWKLIREKGDKESWMGRLDHEWLPIDMDSMRDQFMALSIFSTCPVKLFDEYGKMYDRSP